MKLEVFDDPDSVARAASAAIAAGARTAIAARDRFTVAVSGGHTPWIMLRMLAAEDIPWAGVHVFQVDERVAPMGIRIAILLTCARACFCTLRFDRSKSMSCLLNPAIWSPRLRSMPWLSKRSPGRRRFLISSTSVSARMDTPPRWCLETQCSMSPART